MNTDFIKIINPPAYQPSKYEIELAKVRFVFENHIWEIVDDFRLYKQLKENKKISFPYTEEKILDQANYSLNFWEKSLEKWTRTYGEDQHEFWDGFFESNDWFDKYIISALSEPHCGDCTAVATACGRCYSEKLFKIPSTVTWADKHIGFDLLLKYREYEKSIRVTKRDNITKE